MQAAFSVGTHASFPNELRVGARVAVHTRLSQWSSGFEIAEVTERGYRLRRISDGALLPFEFVAEELRPDPVHGAVQCPDCGLTLADWPEARYASVLIRRHREMGYCDG
jgi:hypothetical protein